MDYKKLSVETWEQLDASGNIVSGYKSTWLANGDFENSDIHIFKDESGDYHLSVLIPGNKQFEIEDPEVNGLRVSVNKYQLGQSSVSLFIDIRCNLKSFLQEFTEVAKDISKNILDNNTHPVEAVNQVIRNWKHFWGKHNKLLLSEEQQIGLICELIILEKLCSINPDNALNNWVGPLGEKHDYNFTDYSFEVKGTRKPGHIHTINGIDQLNPWENKKLIFISFLLSSSENEKSFSLQEIIEKITNTVLQKRPDLIIRFNQLLAGTGYSPMFAEEYRSFRIEVLECIIFTVDDSFPALTSKSLSGPLNSRISMVKYNISLEGLTGKTLKTISLGDYFY